jgi:hypothetical protein
VHLAGKSGSGEDFFEVTAKAEIYTSGGFFHVLSKAIRSV